MKHWVGTIVFVLALGMLVSACQPASPTSPSTTATLTTGALAIGSLSAGTWASLSAAPPAGTLILAPGTCGNFRWSITSLTMVSATGTFAADCGGGISLAGNATASLSGNVANWGAAGNVSGAALLCAFVATGTAALENGGVRVTYSANVCGTSIAGSELLRKR